MHLLGGCDRASRGNQLLTEDQVNILKWTATLICEAIAAVFLVGVFCGVMTYDWATAMFALGSCVLFGIVGYVIVGP